jgi:RNase H-like domain found in reverse transcriptase/Integrase zinc binding domain
MDSLFTDASDTHWSGVITQVLDDQMNELVEDQTHRPLAFGSGSFNGAAECWSTVDKEGFALVESLKWFDFLVAGRELSLVTDNTNLIYIFDPTGHNPGIQSHTASKLMRWALGLSGYRYTIKHLAGGRNVWADLLTRWAVQPPKAERVQKLAKLMLAPIESCAKELYWTTREDLKRSQGSGEEDRPDCLHLEEELWQDGDQHVWIPKGDRDIQIKLLRAAHMGAGGHRASSATFKAMSDHFTWEGLKEDCDEFCRSCLHCLATNTGTTIPRPMGSALHCDVPNGLLNFDYC